MAPSLGPLNMHQYLLARLKNKLALSEKCVWVDLHFVGSDDDLTIRGDNDALAWQHFLSIGEHDLKSVKDTVDKIIEICDDKATKSKTPLIFDLVIDAHGSASSVNWGKDIVTGNNVHKFKNDLERLNPYFYPGISQVKFVSCNTGNALYLLSELSTIWSDVTVIGFIDNQPTSIGTPNGKGPSVTCAGKQCVMYDDVTETFTKLPRPAPPAN